jgi:hypothetical protein
MAARETLSPELLAEVYNSQPKVFCGKALNRAIKDYCKEEIYKLIDEQKLFKRSGKILKVCKFDRNVLFFQQLDMDRTSTILTMA